MGGSTLARAVAALSITQILGWGTTFYLPAVFAPGMAAGTGLPVELVFGGVTVMLFVGALVAPFAGRGFARRGTRPFMVGGSVLVSLGLVLVARAEGAIGFAAGWVVLGLAMPAALGQAASAAMVQIAPERARGAITVLLLFSGLTSTASWPVLIWLDGQVGWRDSLLVFAALHLFLAAPLHRFGLPSAPRRSPPPVRPRALPAADPATEIPPQRVPGAFGLVAAAFALVGFVTWGLPLQLILVLRDLGHSADTAIAVGSLFGPGQVLARLFELAGGSRWSIMTTAVVSLAIIPLALLLLAGAGGLVPVALAFVLLYGFAAGLTSIARAVVPLKLFGAAAYAAATGRLALPQTLAFAVSPLSLAAIRGTGGVGALLAACIAVSGLAVLAIAVLAWRVRAAERRETGRA